MVVREPQERTKVGLGAGHDVFEGQGSVADLEHRHAGAAVVEKLRLDLLEDADGQNGRPRGEVVDARGRGWHL